MTDIILKEYQLFLIRQENKLLEAQLLAILEKEESN